MAKNRILGIAKAQLLKKGVIINDNTVVMKHPNPKDRNMDISIFPNEVYVGSTRSSLGLRSMANLDYLKTQGYSVVGWDNYHENYK